MRIRIAVAGVATLALGSSASTPAGASLGFCMEPRAPSAYLSRPSKPYCYNGCSSWEVDNYKSQVRTYYSELRMYADDVDHYYKNAGEYVECMSKLD